MQSEEIRKIKVSIVEDYLLERISLKRSLSLYKDIKILKDYDSAETLINNINNEKPDIVLMDLGLKKMNGIEATQTIREKYPEIKIIILTSNTGEDYFKASMFAGAKGFIAKNTSSEKIAKIIKAVYFGAYWFDSKIANAYRNNFPKPNITDLEHLYQNTSKDYELTMREMQVLKLLAEGKSNNEIAKEIIISTNTAKAHVGKILNKLNVNDRVQAAVLAVKCHLI